MAGHNIQAPFTAADYMIQVQGELTPWQKLMKFQPFEVSLLTHTARRNSRRVSGLRLGDTAHPKQCVRSASAGVLWPRNSLYCAAMLFALPARSEHAPSYDQAGQSMSVVAVITACQLVKVSQWRGA